jgi:hypothetical protein
MEPEIIVDAWPAMMQTERISVNFRLLEFRLGSKHNFALLDMNLSTGLADFFHGDAALPTELGLQPRADDFDVIALASERHAMLVTADQGFTRKCKIWQEQRRDCLYGLLLLPQGIEFQKRILLDIQRRRRKLLHPQFETSATWSDVHDENLLVQAHVEGFPQVSDLCMCPWEENS